MTRGSDLRKPDFPIETILVDRWSPRAMSGEEISRDELMALFEAARWAPSSFNAQQWRALYARGNTDQWQAFFDLLVEANKAWAKNAAALILFISRQRFEYNNEPSVTHSYDTGLHGKTLRYKAVGKAWSSMAWKVSITIAPERSFGYPKTIASRRWQRSGDLHQRKFFPKSCRHVRCQVRGAESKIACARARLASEKEHEH